MTWEEDRTMEINKKINGCQRFGEWKGRISGDRGHLEHDTILYDPIERTCMPL
jgi:hypothetical protein